MTAPWIRSVAFALLLTPLAGAAAEVSVRDVATRPGVTQRILVIKPEKPLAVAVLFAGSNGLVQIQPDATILRGGNFLVRSREHFAREGFMVAVVDAPSDRIEGPGLDYFRQSAEHAFDIGRVIAEMRREAKLPVWLIGTSRGTTSVANAAIRLPDGGPDGIVLTSSLVGSDRERVPSMNIASIRVPALVVHHEEDRCRYCLFQDVPELMAGLKGAARSGLITFKGGGPVRGNPCRAFHYHGFVGIEGEVVKRIADWIKAQPAAAKRS